MPNSNVPEKRDRHELWSFSGSPDELDAELKSIADLIAAFVDSEPDWLDGRGDDETIADLLRYRLIDGVYRSFS